ncbi:MAG: polysaccharide biosynthesis/export family protein [Acidobacteriota bacterium]|nr:polysaccharide biosynthesis/export family protein [Acidobacteriota bacterium]
MKNLTIAPVLLIASVTITTPAQVKSVTAASNQSGSLTATPNQNPANATRARVLGRESRVAATGANTGNPLLQSRAKPDFNNHTQAVASRRSNNPSDKSLPSVSTTDVALDTSKVVTGTEKPLASSNTSPPTSVTNSTSSIESASSQVYRVGINDVLDIQLADNPTRSSTLYTILEGGLVEYPLAGDPIAVAGLTTPEIAALLRQRLKLFDNPTVLVNVRDYASHTVNITGFVAAPGTMTLRREAVPLYAILAEALMLPEAACATITHQGRTPFIVDLKDPNLTSTLVVPGDAIKVSGMQPTPTEFFFIGGEINSPGQKAFHPGLTLTQAILASGGANRSAGSKVRVSRQGADGRLTTEEHNLQKIQTGKIPDPILQKGDRIEVSEAN